MHVGVPVTDARPLPRDHRSQQCDFASEFVQVLAHVVTFGTAEWGWWCMHDLPPMKQI
jgi:hypothetical protein